MKIAILGAGVFGTALGGVLADKGYDVDYYDPKIEEERLTDVLANAAYVVLCVPSKAAPHLLPHLPHNKPLIVATKGILTDRYFEEFRDWMVMSGPGFAEDIKHGKETLLTATDKRVEELFGTDYLKFDHTEDRRGVLMCGALKNVYAVMAGLLGLDRETLSWYEYVAAAAEEMRSLLARNGASKDTVELACGLGDLELTCALPSRNYEYGLKLRDDVGAETDQTVEGLTTLDRIKRGEITVPSSAQILRKMLELDYLEQG